MTLALSSLTALVLVGVLTLTPVRQAHAAPKAFVAKCSGAIGDTAELQAAASSRAKTVIVPSGSTCTTGPIRLVRPGQSWIIQPGAEIRMAAGASGAVFTVVAPAVHIGGAGAIDGNRGHSPMSVGVDIKAVSDVSIGAPAGPYLTIRNTGLYGVHATDTPRLRVSHVKIVSTGYIGVFAEINGLADVPGVHIDHNLVDRLSSGLGIVEGGIKLHGSPRRANVFQQPVIERNRVALPRGAAGAPAVDIEVWNALGARIFRNHVSGGSMGISLGWISNSRLSQNMSVGPTLYCFEIADSSHVLAERLSCDGEHRTVNGVILDGRTGSDHVAVRAATVERTTGSGIKIQTAQFVTITNPRVELDAPEYAIELLDSHHVAISGGELAGGSTAKKGIMIENGTQTEISRLYIHDFIQNAVMIYGDQAGVLDQIVVRQNNMRRCGACIASQLTAGATLGPSVSSFGNIGANSSYSRSAAAGR